MINDMWVSDGIIVDGYIYFCAWNGNGLYRIKIDNDQIQRIADLPEVLEEGFAYWYITSINNKLYISPCYAKSIACYDIERNTMISISLDEKKIDNWGCASKSFVYKDRIYMIPYASNSIIELEYKNGRTVYYTDGFELVANEIVSRVDPIFGDSVLSDGRIYYIVKNTNSIISFDCETKTFKKYKVGDNHNHYTHIEFYREAILLYDPEHFMVMKWNCKTGEVNTITIQQDWDSTYSAMCRLDNRLWILDRHINRMIEINLDNDSITQNNISTHIDRIEEYIDVPYLKAIDDILFVFPNKGNIILSIDSKTMVTRKYHTTYDEITRREEANAIIDRYIRIGEPITERDGFLGVFLGKVKE